MKWKLGFICILFLLTGCSFIQVDEVNDNQSERLSEEDNNAIIEQTIEDLNIFDWSERKVIQAENIYYLALGDSLTRGVGDETNQYGFTGLLAKEMEKSPIVLSVELDNRGKNGRRSDQLLDLLENGYYDEEIKKASFITISLGGNDVMKIVKSDLFNLKSTMFDEELPSFVKRYNEIIRLIREKTDVPIVLVGFYNPLSILTKEIKPFETIIDNWNGEIEKLSNNIQNVCFVPIDDLFSSNVDMVYHTDFFHPNANGYKLMAERIIETMPSCNIEQINNIFKYEG